MGAELDFYIYHGELSELPERHRDEQERRCRQFGDDTYAGHLGIMPCGIAVDTCAPLESMLAATARLEQEHQKWEKALAIPYLSDRSGTAYVVGGWCAA